MYCGEGKWGLTQVDFSGCLYWEIALEDRLVCSFILSVDMVRVGDRSAFLKRKLVGFGVDRYWYVRV
jgi:hypothetical protein